ncbi:hypothetical protein Anapl_09443 [Anas platyrhynchos]|uniref:Uncharacterized protein n=1 Tax=Anas platyrhynchos TaxID=8839 RepID=R0LBC6_ANAPL|nr:hypothetical protein Anapl_09443 [Anas platyrhynchos]
MIRRQAKESGTTGAPLLPVLLTPSPLPHGPPASCCCSSNGELHPDTAAGRALLGARTRWEPSGTGAVSICKAVGALAPAAAPGSCSMLSMPLSGGSGPAEESLWSSRPACRSIALENSHARN